MSDRPVANDDAKVSEEAKAKVGAISRFFARRRAARREQAYGIRALVYALFSAIGGFIGTAWGLIADAKLPHSGVGIAQEALGLVSNASLPALGATAGVATGMLVATFVWQYIYRRAGGAVGEVQSVIREEFIDAQLQQEIARIRGLGLDDKDTKARIAAAYEKHQKRIDAVYAADIAKEENLRVRVAVEPSPPAPSPDEWDDDDSKIESGKRRMKR